MRQKRLVPFVSALIAFPFGINFGGVTPTPTYQPTPTPTIAVSPTPAIHTSSCDSFVATANSATTIPATVTFRIHGTDSDNVIQAYRYHYGDGTMDETVNPETSHRYEISGTFFAKAEIKDSAGEWKSSPMCEATVSVQSSAIESPKSGCSDLFITDGNYSQPPTTGRFTVSGYDNKGAIVKYKIDYGDGTTEERTDRRFEKLYTKAGTYTVRGYMLDSKNSWKGGSGTCAKSLYVSTTPLTKQPSTGTPTAFTLLALTGGLWSLSLLLAKRFVHMKG